MFHLEMSFPAPGGRGDLRPSMESGTWVLSFPKPCVLLSSVIVIRTKFDLGRGKADARPAPHPATFKVAHSSLSLRARGPSLGRESVAAGDSWGLLISPRKSSMPAPGGGVELTSSCPRVLPSPAPTVSTRLCLYSAETSCVGVFRSFFSHLLCSTSGRQLCRVYLLFTDQFESSLWASELSLSTDAASVWSPQLLQL